jgi:tetratricopeptide (TPR) repeat protein
LLGIAFLTVSPIASACAAEPARGQNKPTAVQNTASVCVGDAERKLLDDLEAVQNALADHLDYSQVDRELAAAFRAFGLDLDVIDPKVATARLCSLARLLEIAAALDAWCRLRKDRLNQPAWRKLSLVARAADRDPWRSAIRESFDRPPSQALPVLRKQAANRNELDKQPARSVVTLAQRLADAGDPLTADAVLQVATRRFPDDIWALLTRASLSRDDTPQLDPAEAVRLYTAAVAMRPRSAMPHLSLALALYNADKSTEAASEMLVATRLAPEHPAALVAVGYAMASLDRTDEAIARYRAAIRLKPDDSQAHSYLRGPRGALITQVT